MTRFQKRALCATACVLALLIGVKAVYAYTVTQSYDSGTGVYTYDVRIQAGDTPIRDFHLVAPKGKKIKRAGVTAPGSFDSGTNGDNFQSHAANPGAGAAGWHTPSATGTSSHLSWYTDDAEAGEQGDTDASDDPQGPGRTLRVQVTRHAKASTAMLKFYVTTDGKSKVPSGPEGGTVPGPVAAVTPSGNDEPAPQSATTVTLTSTEDNMDWEVYLAASVSTGDPATDPMGIGINTNDPIPQAFGISVTPNSGIFGAPPPPVLASTEVQLMVGAAPVGYKFYLVLVGKVGPDIELFSEPLEFTVTS